MDKSTATLPPFSSLIKSRDVEDPINLWLHRPLAYGFVAATFRTPITPNMITLLAIVVGVSAGAMWLWGTPVAMVVGGILVWTSAILDGADGILARAKNMQSEFGRALDGAADSIVAICTVIPAFVHLWFKEGNALHATLVVPAILCTVAHLFLYDYYKESFLRVSQGKSDGENIEQVRETLAGAKAQGRSFLERLAMGQMLLPMLLHQSRLVRWTNPRAGEIRTRLAAGNVTDEQRQAFVRDNAVPMKGWTLISLAPHSYLIAICGMMDRFDIYLWIRIGLMNVMLLWLLFAQRRATHKTLAVWAA